MNKSAPIFVAGHRGLVGSALMRRLQREGFSNLIARTHSEVDLRDATAVETLFTRTKPAYVFLAAARVGGILANSTQPADFIRDNLQIQNNVIDAAWRHGARKLLFLGSSCIYPKMAPQPIREDYLLTGALEPTNEWYAIGKIAGLKLGQAYRRQYGFNCIAAMPTNLYGPGDNFNLTSSHVLPALLRKCHEAKEAGDPEIVVWGTGRPLREFLHVDDLADALVFLMRHYDEESHINVGWGKDVSIEDLARLIADVCGFRGDVRFDTSKPDGTPRKVLDTSRITALGWSPQIGLREGIAQTYRWFLEHRTSLRS